MKKDFKVEDKEYRIVEPGKKVRAEAQKIYMETFYNAIYPKGDQKPAILNEALPKFLKEHGVWDQEKENKIEELKKEVVELEKIFEEGGISLEQAEQKAYELRDKRLQILSISSYKSSYSDLTAENVAEDAKFNYILSQCLVDGEGKKVFESHEAFMSAEDVNEELIETAAIILSSVLNGDLMEFYKGLTENKFLLDYGFVDENLQKKGEEKKFKPFLDKEGKPVKVEK